VKVQASPNLVPVASVQSSPGVTEAGEASKISISVNNNLVSILSLHSNMSESDSCPFCTIARTYPYNATSASSTNTVKSKDELLRNSVPIDPDSTKIEPNTFLVLSAPDVLAFLDIMPMTPGHLLVTTRTHWEKIGDVPGDAAAKLGASQTS
jgi:diadenosine tetraphosphate (Ap4A) HIT family hydrolase